MTPREDALLRTGIAAALADGTCHPDERRQLERLAKAAGLESTNVATDDISEPADLAIRLHDDEGRRAAFDFAVAVCNADGTVNDAERRFLDRLGTELGAAGSRRAPESSQRRAPSRARRSRAVRWRETRRARSTS